MFNCNSCLVNKIPMIGLQRCARNRESRRGEMISAADYKIMTIGVTPIMSYDLQNVGDICDRKGSFAVK